MSVDWQSVPRISEIFSVFKIFSVFRVKRDEYSDHKWAPGYTVQS